jgi:hypothetical protein
VLPGAYRDSAQEALSGAFASFVTGPAGPAGPRVHGASADHPASDSELLACPPQSGAKPTLSYDMRPAELELRRVA